MAYFYGGVAAHIVGMWLLISGNVIAYFYGGVPAHECGSLLVGM